jgi:hypothetical protein
MDNLHTLALSLKAIALSLTATDWASIASGVAASVVAVFTIVLACVGRRQIADTRILQRAYLSVEPKGIEWHSSGLLVGQVAFKNVGKLPATAFASVVNKIAVRNAEWVTPILTDAALPRRPPGLVPIGGEVLQGSGGITSQEVTEAHVDGDKYLYVWGRARFKNGFNRNRYINFCHRYPLAMMDPEPQGTGYSISARFARYHEHGNNAN